MYLLKYPEVMITVGIDEVGRGCWAGPLVAGAVVLGEPVNGLKDSKKLTKKQREALSQIIYERAVAVGLGWVEPADIDNWGISTAVKVAMERALASVQIPFDEVIIDGNINYLPAEPRARAVIKADDSVPAVSAASIVAKVARDNFMATLSERYSMYEFDKHVGYGTAVHLAALKRYGVCDLHRRSFKPVRAILELA